MIKFDRKFNLSVCFMLILLILYCLLSYFFPLTGDDWPNYGNGIFSITTIIKRTYKYYIWWEGRVSSRLLIFALTSKKYIWNLFNSIVVILIPYIGSKIVNKNNKIFNFCLITILILINNYRMFLQCFSWIAGSVTYSFATVLILIYIYYIFNKISIEKNFKKLEILILFIYNIFISMFVENIAVAVLISNILFFAYSFYKKKNIKIYIFFTIASLIGLLIQILSPGTSIRMALEANEFYELNFFDKIFTNISKFIKFEYFQNPMMLLLISSSLIILVLKKEKNKILKFLTITFFSIVPLITIISNIALISPFTLKFFESINLKFAIFNDSNNLILKLYWIIYTALYFILLIKYITSKNKLKIIFIFIVGMSSILSMLLAPTWSERVTFMSVVFNYIISLIIFEDLNVKENIIVNKFMTVFIILYLIFTNFIYYNVHKYGEFRDNYIIEQYEKGEKLIKFYMPADYLIWVEFPYNDQYRSAFNNILNIDENIEYEIAYGGWKYGMIFNKKYIYEKNKK